MTDLAKELTKWFRGGRTFSEMKTMPEHLKEFRKRRYDTASDHDWEFVELKPNSYINVYIFRCKRCGAKGSAHTIEGAPPVTASVCLSGLTCDEYNIKDIIE